MKNTLLVIVALLAVSCGKGKEAQTYEKVTEDKNTKPIKVDDNATKPVKELTAEEKVIGTYELKEDENAGRLVFLDNGVAESYSTGKKDEEATWKLTKEGEIHTTYPNGNISVGRINKDGSITAIAFIRKDRKRIDIPKEQQLTFKKIK